MDSLLRLLRKLELLIRRGRFHRELDQEMTFHREQAEQELRAEAMSAEEARYVGRRRFGNDPRLKEQSYEIVGFRLESILLDLRYAVRQLRKNPGFACTAVVVLALGIAGSVAIFAFVDAALVQPLPYQNPSRLVSVYSSSGTCRDCDVSYQDYLDWKKYNTVFSSLEAWKFTVHRWKSFAGVKALRAARVSGGFFQTLGVSPMLGRVFTDTDDTPAAPRTVLLPFVTWQSHFGGRRDIVGSP